MIADWWKSALICLPFACGSSSTAPILSVSQAAIQYAADFDQIYLEWAYAGQPSRYVVESRVPPASFADLADAPGSQLALMVTLPADSPEMSEIEFRLRAEPGGERSVPKSIHRGIRPPDLHCPRTTVSGIYCATGGPFQISFASLSRLAERVVLDRRVVQDDGSAGSWSAVATGRVASNEYLDTDLAALTDGAHYEYRATAIAPAAQSATILVRTEAVALSSPSIAVTTVPGGTHLTLKNASQRATTIFVARRPQGGSEFSWVPVSSVGVQPGGTAALDDGAPAGIHQYVVQAYNPSGHEAKFSAQVYGFGVVPLESSGFTARTAAVPVGTFAARAPSGAFAVLGNVVFPASPPNDGQVVTLGIVPAGDDGKAALGLSRPNHIDRFALDAAGHPHAVYADVPSGWRIEDPFTIVHAWHDGTGWQREEIATRKAPFWISFNFGSPPVWLDLGPDGTLHAAWFNDASAIEVARLSAGTWVIEDLTSALGTAYNSYWRTLAIAGDESGAPHLLPSTGDRSQGSHVFRDGQGWHVEDVPFPGPPPGGEFESVKYLFAGAGRVTVVGAAFHFDTVQDVVTMLERTDSGWQPPLTFGTATGWQAARSPDGSRVAVANGPLSFTDSVVTLWVRAAGSTVERRFVKVNGTPWAIGFGTDQKAWVIDWFDSSVYPGNVIVPGHPAAAALFEEQ